jgi:hypothetical protein
MSSIFQRLTAGPMLIAAVTLCLAACGGGGTSPLASNTGEGLDQVGMPPTPERVFRVLPKPLLSFTDTGLSVTDGTTRIGALRAGSFPLTEEAPGFGAKVTPSMCRATVPKPSGCEPLTT